MIPREREGGESESGGQGWPLGGKYNLSIESIVPTKTIHVEHVPPAIYCCEVPLYPTFARDRTTLGPTLHFLGVQLQYRITLGRSGSKFSADAVVWQGTRRQTKSGTPTAVRTRNIWDYKKSVRTCQYISYFHIISPLVHRKHWVYVFLVNRFY